MNRQQRRAMDRAARSKKAPRRDEHGAPMIMPLAMAKKDDPVLHRPTTPVLTDDIETEMAVLSQRFRVTCRALDGMALAANQVGLPWRAVWVTEGSNGTMWLNPQVRLVGDATEVGLEGCLTLPGKWFAVERHLRVEVVARRIGVQEAEKFQVMGLAARMWQHEADHLDGKLICDHWPLSTPADTKLPTGAEQRLAEHAAAARGR